MLFKSLLKCRDKSDSVVALPHWQDITKTLKASDETAKQHQKRLVGMKSKAGKPIVGRRLEVW